MEQNNNRNFLHQGNYFKNCKSLIFLQFMTGKNIDEKECFGKMSMQFMIGRIEFLNISTMMNIFCF
jgi:hypothetical protein